MLVHWLREDDKVASCAEDLRTVVMESSYGSSCHLIVFRPAIRDMMFQVVLWGSWLPVGSQGCDKCEYDPHNIHPQQLAALVHQLSRR